MLKPKCSFGVVTAFAGDWATAAGEARMSATKTVRARRFTGETLGGTGPREDNCRAIARRSPLPLLHTWRALGNSILIATTSDRKERPPVPFPDGLTVTACHLVPAG